MKSLQSPEMGAKLSKKGSKAGEGKGKEEMAEPALTTFDKTATLPASFRKRNVNQESTTSPTSSQAAQDLPLFSVEKKIKKVYMNASCLLEHTSI